MIRNILYSLFLHFALVILIYSSFSFSQPIEIDKTTKVAISFISSPQTSSGNGTNTAQTDQSPNNSTPIKPKLIPEKKLPLIKKINPKPKKPKATPQKAPPQKAPPQKDLKPSEKKLDMKPQELANKMPEPKKDDSIKPEIKTPNIKVPEPKEEPNVKKEEIKEDLEDEKDKSEVGEDTEDQQDESQYYFAENSLEGLDLLVREKFNIQNQIKRCYQNALKEDGDNKMVINARIFIAQDGFINLDTTIFKQFAQYQNKDLPDGKTKSQANLAEYNKAIETVKKSLKFCSPLRNLPQDKYNIWKEIDLRFD